MEGKDRGITSGSFYEENMAPFKWRKNSTQEIRLMRNQRKKRKRLQKRNITLDHSNEGEIRVPHSKRTGTKGTLPFPRAKVSLLP